MESLYEEILKFLNDCGFDLTGEQLDEIAVRVSKKPTLKKRKTRPFLRGAGASRYKLPASKYLSRYGIGRGKIKECKEDPKPEEKLTKGKTWYKFTKANKEAATTRRVDESTKLKEPLKFYDRGHGHGDMLKLNPTRKKKLDDKYKKYPKLRLVKETILAELSNEKLRAYKQAAIDDTTKHMDDAAEKHGAKGMIHHVDMDRLEKRSRGISNAEHKLASRNKPKNGFYGYHEGPVWRKVYRANEETEITELTDKTMLKAADRHMGMSILHQRISPKRFEHGGKALKILTHSLGRKKRILNTPNHPEGKAVRRFSEDFIAELSDATVKKAVERREQRGAEHEREYTKHFYAARKEEGRARELRHHNERKVHEETISELSNATLSSYSKKAWGQVKNSKKLASSYKKWDKRLTKADDAHMKVTGKGRFSEETVDEMKYPSEKKAKKFEHKALVAKLKDKYTNRKDRKAMRMGPDNPHTSTPGPGSSVLYDLKGNGSL